ncbi:hypothetical protein ACHHYP_02155 [Achlya hypogyna]|uniref:Uncharacterized protein n=1 Tax=Achlya hypogyna TaxID=1202772 RepID=A0A1V9ZSB5_ACHHY|nr:hypothetical protein ACHHYP_02155 [Achlya hypogyna]
MSPTTTTSSSATPAVPEALAKTEEVPVETPDPTVTNEEDAAAKKDKMRWGKWTREEEAYTTRLIADFSAGLLTDVTNGTTMRSWLSTKLRCCPMRISKKFVGEASIGKRMFERNDARINEMSEEEKARRAKEVDKLHDDFCESWIREEKERLENKANGSRKRKRNKKKDANGLPIPAIKKPNFGLKPPMLGTSPSQHHLMSSGLSSLLQRPPMLKAPARPPFNTMLSKATSIKKPFKPEVKTTLTIKTMPKSFVATTPRGPVKRVNSVPHMTKPTQAPSLTPTKKSMAHASATSAQIQELQLQLASRSKSLSFDLADPFNRSKDCDDLDMERDFRELDFMSDCWIPEALCDVPAHGPYDPFTFADNALHGPLKEEELDAALSPTSVIDFYSADAMWAPLMDQPASDVFLAPLYDCLF